MRAAIAALALTIAASCVSIAFDIDRLSVASHLLSDISSRDLARLANDILAAQTSDNQTSVIAIVELATLIIAGVSFIAWFHRAYDNLRDLGATTMRYAPGWAIGAWFVPVLNFWRPKQIANDIWRGSDPRHPGRQPVWREPVSPLLWFWWSAWILLFILSRAASQAWTSAVSTHAIRSATSMDIAAEVTSIIAAGLSIALVRTLTKREGRRASADEALMADVATG
jgi:hypothetical protein